MKMRANRPPAHRLIPPLPLHLSTLEMAIVGKNQNVASTLFTGDDVHQILCHHGGTYAEQDGLAFLGRLRELSMIVQKLPRHYSIVSCFQIATLVALCDQFGTTYTQFCKQILCLDPQCGCLC